MTKFLVAGQNYVNVGKLVQVLSLIETTYSGLRAYSSLITFSNCSAVWYALNT